MKLRFIHFIILCSLLLLSTAQTQAQWVEHGTEVVTRPYSQYHHDMLYDNDDGAYIVWEDYRNNAHFEIYMQRIDAYGNPLWAEDGVTITGMLAVDQRYPAITYDGSGGALVAYQDNSMIDFNIKVQRVDPNGNVLWGFAGVLVCGSSNDQLYPVIAPDWYGGAYIAWQDERDNLTARDIYMQRVDAAGVPQWTTNGIVISTAPSHQEYMQMIPDGTGGVIITWHDKRNDMDGDIFAQRVNSSGVVQWTAGGEVICVDIFSSQSTPRIARDGFGGAVITWSDGRGPGSNIYAQRINSAGIVQWAPNGIPITYTDYVQYQPDITYDSWNYCTIITWTHGTASSSDIRAQRLNSSGAALWSGGGALVCTKDGTQNNPRIIPDYWGGAYIAWVDERYYEKDIYIQHIDENGDSQWISGGIPVASTVGYQQEILLISDNTYSPILSWHDQRIINNMLDIFAQRIDEHGYWGNPAPKITGVDDVPNDEGLRLMVTWDRSRIDDFPEEIIAYYEVLRSPVLDYTWESMATIDAYQLDNYTYTDTTLMDNHTYYYMVIAHTSDPLVYWQSSVESGFSVDDMTPAPPAMLAGEQSFEPAGLLLTWEPNGEPDIAHYAVYRGTSEEFVPAPGNLVSEPVESAYLDGEWHWSGGYCYKVSAVDDGDNESAFAMLSPEAGDETPVTPLATYLEQNYPNPFNPSTRIAFGLFEQGHVALRIYDAAGKLVRTLVNERREAGIYGDVWDGKDSAGQTAASGVYFYNLSAGSFKETKKMVLLR